MNVPATSLLLRAVEAAARVILECGGETYRVEETVLRMCAPFPHVRPEVIAFPTGVLITLGEEDRRHTTIKRIPVRVIDLKKLNDANDISRSVAGGSLTLEDAYARLCELLSPKPESIYKMSLAAGLSSASFALVFSRYFPAFLLALFAGYTIHFINAHLQRREVPTFVCTLLGGALAAFIGYGGAALFGLQAYTTAVVSGSIMPMLPGLALTNAIRDTIHGDLVSGMSRLGEALLVSVSLAAGTGIALHFMLGGAS